jgi:hypothetical protein
VHRDKVSKKKKVCWAVFREEGGLEATEIGELRSVPARDKGFDVAMENLEDWKTRFLMPAKCPINSPDKNELP